jgi:hypothetical protein
MDDGTALVRFVGSTFVGSGFDGHEPMNRELLLMEA